MWIIGPILITILIAFKFYFPIDKSGEHKYYSLDQLRSEFFKIDLISMLIFFVSIGFWSVLFYNLFDFLNNKNELLDKFIIVIPMDLGYWMFCSFLLGLSFSSLTIIIFLRSKLKERTDRFWIYYNKKYGFNAFLMFKILFISLAMISCILIFFGLRYQVLVNDKQMIIRELFSFQEKVNNIDNIKSIKYIEKKEAPNGNINDNPYYKIQFNDGYNWTTNGMNRKDLECIWYIQDVTKIKIDTIEIEQ